MGLHTAPNGRQWYYNRWSICRNLTPGIAVDLHMRSAPLKVPRRVALVSLAHTFKAPLTSRLAHSEIRTPFFYFVFNQKDGCS